MSIFIAIVGLLGRVRRRRLLLTLATQPRVQLWEFPSLSHLVRFLFVSFELDQNKTALKHRNNRSVGAYVNTLDMLWGISINGDWSEGCAIGARVGVTKTGGQGSNWEFKSFVFVTQTFGQGFTRSFLFLLA